MRVTILHNPTAGDRRPPAEVLLRLLREAGYEPLYQSTKASGFEEALRAPADLVIAAGGDGTVAKVAAALPDRRRPITILPLGGANNIARSLGTVGDVARLIGQLRDAELRRVDVASARGPWGERLVLEGVGLGALAAASADAKASDPAPADKTRVGREALGRRLQDGRPWRLRLELDSDVLEGEFLMVEAVNLQTTGPALPLAPETDPGDGCLDLVAIGPRHRERMLAWLDRPGPGEPPPGERRRCRRLAFDWANVPLRLDDARPDPPADPVRVAVEVESEPLRVLVPRAARRGQPDPPRERS